MVTRVCRETVQSRLCVETETTSCCLSNTLESVGVRPVKWCEAPCLGCKRWAESPPLAVVQPFQRVPGCAIHCWQHSFLRCGPTERCAVHNCTTRWNSMRRAAMHRQCRGCGQAGPTPSIRRCLWPEPERGQPRQPRAAVGRHHAAPANGSSQSYNGGFTAPNLCFGACSLGQNTDTKILFEIRE